MRTATIALFFAFLCHSQQRTEKPTRIWNRTGPLGDTPKHVTDAFPLSDQQNKGGWVKFEPMSDEFEGKDLDRSKWTFNIAMVERPPARPLQREERDRIGWEAPPDDAEGKAARRGREAGYHDYTSAALHSQDTLRIRLLRGQGQAHELGWFKFLLVPQGRHPQLADGDRCIRDWRQGEGLREQIQHECPRLGRRPRKRSIGTCSIHGSHRGGWPTIITSMDSIGARTNSSLRGWGACSIRREHSLAPAASLDLRQRDDARLVRDARGQ